MIRSLAVALAAMLLAAAPAQAQEDPLRDGFRDPPQSARPWVWWHWMDGNVTIDGIDRDLAWFRDIGLGGFQVFDVAQPGVPKVVDHRLIYMHPDWQAAFRHAIEQAARLKLEVGIASSPGWSETGGPWVAPEAAMKKLVWSSTFVEGGRRFTGMLAPPPAVPGPFQDLARDDKARATAFYRDVKVLAWRVPADAAPLPPARVTSSGGPLDAALLADPRLERASAATLPLSQGSPQWIRFDYDRPQTVRALVYAPTRPGLFDLAPAAMLEASDDGVTFRKVADLAFSPRSQSTVSFAPVTARSFRVSFSPPADPGSLWRRVVNLAAPGIANKRYDRAPAPADLRLQRLALLPDARVNRFEDKAGFGAADDYYAIETPAADPGSAIPQQGVLDLTDKLRPDRTLDWTPPRGRWEVLRLGWSLTGAVNAPAPAEATGYEVDKLDAAAVRDYMARYLATYRAVVPPELLGKGGITTILNDSIESGPQNWTGAMLAEFRARRGYDPTPWLPAITGRIVGSAAASDKFLWDYRQTIAELIAVNHYGEVARSAHEAGLRVRGEALEDHRPVLGDDMAMRAHADEPTGAIWAPNEQGHVEPMSVADLKGAASVSHLWGTGPVAAESFTSGLAPWAGSPRSLKRVADAALAMGVTRFMIHSSVHQPVEGHPPGLTLGIFGQFFNRYETWAGQAKPWVSYLARSAYLLQQGRYAADIAYFFGEEAPLTALYAAGPPADLPAGHGFDFVDAEALKGLLGVRDGQLVTPSGMHYRALLLGGTSRRMTLGTLRRIAALADAGALVIGPRPLSSPSFADDPAAFAALVARLWDGGKVVDAPAADALSHAGIAPDWRVEGQAPELMVLHRTLDHGELYFLSSRSRTAARAEVSFRVTGLAPELWDADTGEVRPLAWRSEGGRTIVPLDFDPDGAAFVLFRKSVVAPAPAIPAPEPHLLQTFDQGWTLAFQPDRGGPAEGIPASAGSWSDSPDPRVRYFSGTGTYSRTIDVPAAMLAGQRILLDLGEVRELVDVVINGQTLRTLWKPPYRLDVTQALKPGANRVELRVTNLWVNRLIGDAQPGAAPLTSTALPSYRPDAKLLPSGLIGPVRLVGER
ncbi:glycosyl hydrolase [Sphingomonas sp.]|uniref:glycosyl hydrolase n=1 Tax=Sphingomonas sp. TaxID=28214 RepID=UPI001B235A6C|nr:glycosyl hydrolase [Sphingomonas sp.]MBO9713877.1 glycoside hydrolase [Sphingomonas sp.]